jgi:hypothetical protein
MELETKEDKKIQCNSCGAEFVWSVGEQQSMLRKYQEGIFQSFNPPKKCKQCCIRRNELKMKMQGRNY